MLVHLRTSSGARKLALKLLTIAPCIGSGSRGADKTGNMKVFRPAAAIARKTAGALRSAPRRAMASPPASKIVHMDNINKNVVEMEYAVRGAVSPPFLRMV